MTRDRFETLAEAWGGDVARWPDEAREAAAELMARDPAFTAEALARAAALDEVLAASPVAPASRGLAERIVAGAPAPRRRRAWGVWLAPAGLGAGLAAAGVAGVLLGVELNAAAAAGDTRVAELTDEDFSLYLEEDAG